MVYKDFLLVSAFLCSAVTAEAQVVHGVVRAQGGLGTAQNKSDIALFCELPGIEINPFVGIAGVDKEKWNLTTDRTFIPVVGDYPYRSTREVEYEGHTLYYGVDFRTHFSAKHHISGSFLGNNTRMDGSGTFYECNYLYGLPSMSHDHKLDLPSRDGDLYKGNVSYTYRTDRKGESLKVGYRIDARKTSDNQSEGITWVELPTSIRLLNYEQDAKEVKQNFSFDWTRPLGEGHTLTTGIEYENRQLTGTDHHDYGEYLVDDILYTYPHSYNNYTYDLDYRTSTYIFRLGYDLKRGAFEGHAGLDYQHMPSTISPSAMTSCLQPALHGNCLRPKPSRLLSTNASSVPTTIV